MSEERKKQLLEIFDNVGTDRKQLAIQLIDEVVFLEEKINEIKKAPFYRKSPSGNIHPLDNLKVYKELSNQYNMDIKTLGGFLNKQDVGTDSPLDQWLKNEYKK